MQTKTSYLPVGKPCWPILLLLFAFGCAKNKFYADTPVSDPIAYQKLQEQPGTVDSVTVRAGVHYKRGPFYRLLWGRRHRDAWAAPVTVPVLQVDKAKGGLTVEKIGGGMQTINATLQGGDGLVYSLRSVDKRPEVSLPGILRKTFVADLMRDQTSALNPYAALVVAPLAKAAGIHSPTPVLVYVKPDEENLGEHKKLLSDKLYMLEEKFNDKRSLVGNLAGAYDIVNTDKMLDNRYTSDNHTIDQMTFAKTRLLDLIIGDRDRHEEQWEWVVYKSGNEYTYVPIPKDRDNAFFRFDDGLLSWLISRKWANRKYKTFSRNYEDVKALMIKSEFIDRRILPELTAQQFDSVARVLQSELTNEVIDQAVRQLPDTIYRLQATYLTQNLRSRRDNLPEAARKFYEELSEEVLVIGTDQKEYFEVNRLNDEKTEITLRSGSDNKIFYHRVFTRTETDEVILYGLNGDDVFELKGKAGKGIKVTVHPGQGKYKITDQQNATGQGSKLLKVEKSKNDRKKITQPDN